MNCPTQTFIRMSVAFFLGISTCLSSKSMERSSVLSRCGHATVLHRGRRHYSWIGELSAESDLRVFSLQQVHLIALPTGLQRCEKNTKTGLLVYRCLIYLSYFEKKGQIRFLPLFEIRSARLTKVYLVDSCNSRRSSAFDCLRLSFFLLLKIWPGGGSSFRTRASPWGIPLVFIFDAAINVVSSLPSLRCPLQSHRGERASPRHQSRS